MIKSELSLIGNKPNIFSFPQSTIDAHKIEDEQKDIIISSVSLFMNRSKSHFSHEFVKYHIDNKLEFFDFVNIPKYPLPVVYNKTTRRVIVNIKSLGKSNVSNIDMRDLYTIILYGHCCSYFSGKKDIINKKHYELYCQYMIWTFIKLFAKKYGIIGSYVDLLSIMKFLVAMYTLQSFFGLSTKDAITKASSISKYNYNKNPIDLSKYDLSKFSDLLTALKDNEVTPGLDIYRFTDSMIRIFGQFGVMNLPIFEDLMRFSCTIICSNVNGNSYFPTNYQAFNPDLYSKLILVIKSVL